MVHNLRTTPQSEEILSSDDLQQQLGISDYRLSPELASRINWLGVIAFTNILWSNIDFGSGTTFGFVKKSSPNPIAFITLANHEKFEFFARDSKVRFRYKVTRDNESLITHFSVIVDVDITPTLYTPQSDAAREVLVQGLQKHYGHGAEYASEAMVDLQIPQILRDSLTTNDHDNRWAFDKTKVLKSEIPQLLKDWGASLGLEVEVLVKGSCPVPESDLDD